MKHKKIYHFQEGTNFWRIIKPYLHYSSIITSTPTRSRPYSVNAYNVHIISNIEMLDILELQWFKISTQSLKQNIVKVPTIGTSSS